MKQRFENDLSILPQKHKDILNNTVKSVIISSDKPSGYNAEKKILRINENFSKGHMIHETGHVIADYYKVYDDKAFVSVLSDGLDDIGLDKIIEDTTTFAKPIWRVESPKFISKYQGFLNEEIGINNGLRINLHSMREYFSEGYREFFENMENLKVNDVKLFDYIRKLVE